MDLLHLVDRLEELVASAQRMPIGSRAIVDRRRLLDIIDQMRVAVPDEVREAREIVAQSAAIRRNAEEEARLLVAHAEEQSSSLVDEHHVTRAARLRADELAEDAERKLDDRISAANADIERRLDESRRLAEQQMTAADQYAQELLGRLERQLDAFQRSVRSGLEQLTRPLDGDGGEPRTDPADQAAALTDAILAAASAAPRSLDEAERRAASEQPEDALIEPFDEPSRPQPARLGELIAGLGEPEPMDPADPGVIDDFAMPPLDDEPEERRSGGGDAPNGTFGPSNGTL